MTEDFQEIDLASLSDDELAEQMHNDLYDGMAAEIVEGTNILLGRGWSASQVLDDALVAGMKIVGIDFRDGILFVPEVLLAANSMKAGMAILRPLLAETGAEPVGKVVIGTVKGDIHDIGKNLVGMMLEGAGFEVVDLGINTDAEKFIAALELHKPDILGMSALLTTTMPYMKVVIERPQGARHPRRLHRARRRRAAQRGVRQGRRRRRVLPRCRRGRRDGPRAGRQAPCQRRLRRRPSPAAPRVLVIGCGALARELVEIARRPGFEHLDVTCLPAKLHNRPGRIPAAVQRKIRAARARYATIFVAYADCGTGGLLDRVLEEEGVERLAGAHCYEFYAGRPDFARLTDEEPATFFLTDFLARNFDRAGDQGPRHRPAPRAAADLLRQLPAGRLPRPDRRSRRCRGAPREPPTGSASNSSPPDRPGRARPDAHDARRNNRSDVADRPADARSRGAA